MSATTEGWKRVAAPEGSPYPHIWHDGGNRIIRPHGAGGYCLISFGWAAPHRPEAVYNVLGDTLRELTSLEDVPRCDYHDRPMIAVAPDVFACPCDWTGPYGWQCAQSMTRNPDAVEPLRGWLANA